MWRELIKHLNVLTHNNLIREGLLLHLTNEKQGSWRLNSVSEIKVIELCFNPEFLCLGSYIFKWCNLLLQLLASIFYGSNAPYFLLTYSDYYSPYSRHNTPASFFLFPVLPSPPEHLCFDLLSRHIDSVCSVESSQIRACLTWF